MVCFYLDAKSGGILTNRTICYMFEKRNYIGGDGSSTGTPSNDYPHRWYSKCDDFRTAYEMKCLASQQEHKIRVRLLPTEILQLCLQECQFISDDKITHNRLT
jgi:hypothetical protein